jgi:sec-independent protein translocase protein TatA
MPFGIQPWHLIVVLIVALIIFGPSKLPQLGRSMGTFFRDLRAGARDMNNGFKEAVQEADAAKPAAVDAASPAKGAEAAQEKGNFCISCGAPNPPNAQFCNACGKSIKG